MGVPGGHHRQGTVPADPTEGVHAAGCGLAPLPSWPPAPCPALRLLETSPTGDPSPEGAPGWHRGGFSRYQHPAGLQGWLPPLQDGSRHLQLLALNPQPQLGRILQPPPCTPGHDGSLSPCLPSHRDPAQGSGRWGAKPLLFPPPSVHPNRGAELPTPPASPPTHSQQLHLLFQTAREPPHIAESRVPGARPQRCLLYPPQPEPEPCIQRHLITGLVPNWFPFGIWAG